MTWTNAVLHAARVRVTRLAPSSRLSPFVRELRVVETDVEVERVLVPEPSVLLGFRFGGAAVEHGVALPDLTATGLRSTARRMKTTAGGGLVLVAFHELGARAFLELPVHELFDQTVPLEGLVRRTELERTSDEVRAATSNAERVRFIEAFLQRTLRDGAPDQLIAEAVARIRGAHGLVQISALASQLGLSRDRFEKRFRQAVGSTPKHYASQVRLRRAMSLLSRAPSLTHLALEAGYFDQSHFVREFRRVTGEPPGRFFAHAAYC